LQALLPGKVAQAGASEYTSSVESYFFRTARQTPALIILPETAEDVSTAVKVLAQHTEVQFAVSSGGHSPHPNVANTNTGVTIDLQALNTIERDAHDDTVYRIGAGARWGAVYDVLADAKRAALGSRECTVGVGGYITGGMASNIPNIANLRM
jgi:FAD/FMN-containing dehydrogenase